MKIKPRDWLSIPLKRRWFLLMMERNRQRATAGMTDRWEGIDHEAV